MRGLTHVGVILGITDGLRRKQANDQHYDWIGIRRGIQNVHLPPVSPTDGHYSFIARSHALQLPEGRSWADTAPGQGVRTCCTIAAPQVLDGAGIVPQCSQGPSFNHALAADPAWANSPVFNKHFPSRNRGTAFLVRHRRACPHNLPRRLPSESRRQNARSALQAVIVSIVQHCDAVTNELGPAPDWQRNALRLPKSAGSRPLEMAIPPDWRRRLSASGALREIPRRP